MVRRPHVVLFGAPPDTNNMGVSALFASTVSALRTRLPNVECVVIDNGIGARKGCFQIDEDAPVLIFLHGARAGRRYYMQENLTTIYALARLGPLGPRVNPVLKLIDSASAVLDISGGDSFSDLYGATRFMAVSRMKLIALHRRIPLILLPQTYGPYRKQSHRQLAKRIIRSAAMAWARDPQSYKIMQELLGQEYVPERHLSGVDMAFGLVPRDASSSLPIELQAWIAWAANEAKVIGVNVSGLIYNDPHTARARYGFRADYRELVHAFIDWLLSNTSANLLLIPHVMAPPDTPESDVRAAERVLAQIDESCRDRVQIAPSGFDQCELKWLISKMDWFCGTRMHATIAALSTGVPTAALVYSDKAQGVFELCGLGSMVVDPRRLSTADAVDALRSTYLQRENARESLTSSLISVMAQWDQQITDICDLISSCAQTVSASGQR